MLIKKVLTYMFYALGIYWMLLSIHEYFLNHDEYFAYILDFRYIDLLIITAFLTFFFLTVVCKATWKNNQFQNLKTSGWQYLVYLLLLICLIFTIFGFKVHLFEEYSFFSSIISIISRISGILLSLMFLTHTFFAVGKFVLDLIKINTTGLKETLYSIALGTTIVTFLIMLLGALSILSFYPVLISALLINIFLHKYIISFWRVALFTEYEVNRLSIRTTLLLLLLLFAISISLLKLIKPLPLGYDDSNLYMNIPNLLKRRGALVKGGQAYNWSLLMSLGFVAFNSPTIALGISFLGYIYSIGALVVLSKRYLNWKNVLLLVVIVYSLPAIIHQSSDELKVDLGLLFVSLTTINLLLDWFGMDTVKLKLKNLQSIIRVFRFDQTKYIILIGALLGFAFGVKYTSLILFLAAITVVVYKHWKNIGVLLSLSFTMFLTFQLNLFSFSNTYFSAPTIRYSKIFFLVCTIVVLLIIAIKQQKKYILNILLFAGLMTTFAFVSFSPWLIKNYSETNKLNISSLLKGKSESPIFDTGKANKLYTEKFPDTDTSEQETVESEPLNKLDTKTNPASLEVTRYLGFENGALKYLTLPYDVVVNTNVNTKIVNIGFLLLSLLPLQIIFSLRSKKKYLAILLLLFGIILFFVPSIIVSKVGSQCLSDGISANCISESFASYKSDTLSLLSFLYIPITLLMPLFSNLIVLISKLSGTPMIIGVVVLGLSTIQILLLITRNQGLKVLTVILGVSMIFWMLLGNGIYWYALFAFVTLFFYLVYYFSRIETKPENSFLIDASNICIYTWLIMAFSSLFVYQPNDKYIFLPTMIRYMIGEATAMEALDETNPAYPPAIEQINSNNGLVYRVGTFFPYYIDDNHKRVYSDIELRTFLKLNNSSESKEEIATKLYLLGYRYFLVDINLISIDTSPNGAFTDRFNALRRFISRNSKLKLISTDKLTLDEQGERQYKFGDDKMFITNRYDAKGEVVYEPITYTFEILE